MDQQSPSMLDKLHQKLPVAVQQLGQPWKGLAVIGICAVIALVIWGIMAIIISITGGTSYTFADNGWFTMSTQDYKFQRAEGQGACQTKCTDNDACKAYVFNTAETSGSNCYTITDVSKPKTHATAGWITGTKVV